jgi:hypothetical protein
MSKLELQILLQKFRYEYLKELINKDSDFWNTIDAIKITSRYDNINPYINVDYIHETKLFSPSDYSLNPDEDDLTISHKKTPLQFGYKNGKFYINGKTNIGVYSKRDNPNVPLTYNELYDSRIDQLTQTTLMQKYHKNKNIPEWLAIAFMNVIRFDEKSIRAIINDISFE